QRRSATYPTARRSNTVVKTIALSLVAVAFALAVASCGGSSPVAPGAPPPTVMPTLSGQVQQNVTWGDPPLADALVEVVGADGLKKTGLSDDEGFYQIAVAPG